MKDVLLQNDSDYLYLACPYTDKDPLVEEQRYLAVVRAAGHLMLQGFNVFSPIAHSHPIALHGMTQPTTGLFWKKQDIPLLKHASALVVLMLPGWEHSKGLAWEIETARALHMPLLWLNSDFSVYDIEKLAA